MAAGQGAKTVKKYCAEQKSCWQELYGGDCENVAKQQVACKLFDKDVKLSEIRQAIMHQPHVKVVPKSAALKLDDGALDAMTKKSVKELNAVPRSQTKVVIDVAVAENIPFVKFFDAGMVSNGAGKTPKYTPPRILISLKDYNIPANHGVRINTGLIVTIPGSCMGRDVVDGKLTVTNKRVAQDPFVIIPQVTCVGDDKDPNTTIIPSMYVRDADDTGLLTINFTTRKSYANNLVLQVVLVAYSVDKPLERVVLDKPIDNMKNTSLFKTKDNSNGRAVKNPKVKFLTNDFEMSGRQLQMATFDHKTMPVVAHAEQKVQFKNITTVFSSRKREWHDPRLVTITGIFNPKNKVYAKAHVVDGSMFQHNTHCLTFVSGRLLMFSQRSSEVALNSRIINGSFSDVANYALVNKRLRECVDAMQNLYSGVLSCKGVFAEIQAKLAANPDDAAYQNITMDKLVTMYDYDRVMLKLSTSLLDRIHTSDENIFTTRTNQYNSPYSVVVKTSISMLAYAFLPHLFSPEDLEQLSLRYSNISAAAPSNAEPTNTKNLSLAGTVLEPTTTTEPATEPMAVDEVAVKRKRDQEDDAEMETKRKRANDEIIVNGFKEPDADNEICSNNDGEKIVNGFREPDRESVDVATMDTQSMTGYEAAKQPPMTADEYMTNVYTDSMHDDPNEQPPPPKHPKKQ